MRPLTIAALTTALAASAASAQRMTGVAAVDSAAVARTEWAAGAAALRRNDLDAARRAFDRAAAAWPTQPTYLWGKAVVAARQRDSAAVHDALRDYARLGLGRVLSDTTFDAFRSTPWFEPVAAEHRANLAPLARSVGRVTLSDSTLWPEGVDHDPRTGNLYVSSIRHRTIVEVSIAGRERELWPRHQPGIGAVMGVRVAREPGELWATLAGMRPMLGFTPSDSGIAALVRVRIADGAILRRWDLPATAPHVLGDLAVAEDGTVYVTDSGEPVLYVLAPGADSLERITSPLFRSLQGVAPAAGGIVYVADYSHGLLRVDMRTRAVSRLNASSGITTLGVDGIALFRNSIVAVQNGVAPARVVRFQLDSAGTGVTRAEVIDRNWAVADEPTIGTLIGPDFVYVANSQWEKYTENGARRPGTALKPPVLLSVPLQP